MTCAVGALECAPPRRTFLFFAMMAELLVLRKRFCCVCKEPFRGRRQLLLNNPCGSLTRAGPLLLFGTGLDISSEEPSDATFVCKNCNKDLKAVKEWQS